MAALKQGPWHNRSGKGGQQLGAKETLLLTDAALKAPENQNLLKHSPPHTEWGCTVTAQDRALL